MKMNRNVNKYIKDCKHFFPFLSKNEKIFLKRLKVNIVENIDSTNITYDDLCNKFGYPSDIIISYFEDQDANYLIKQSRIRNILKKAIIICTVAILVCCLWRGSSILFLSLPVSALDQKKEIIKLDNGYYLETIIEETSMARAANQKTARKTANYKNAQGAIMFSVTVTGTFTYTGSSSTCTKSVAEASSKNTNWKISSKSASKSGNKATAKAIAKRYVDGVAVETQNCTVTLICSSNGSLK